MPKTLGIILAGGKSSRLYPATLVVTKQTLPIYDKPLIYYPLSTLMLSGIRDFVIISTPKEKPVFEELFYDASRLLGINITFAVQHFPKGIADAFNVVEDSLYEGSLRKYDRVALILGDNIFYGASLTKLLQNSNQYSDSATCFAIKVSDPERFGVVEMDDSGKAVSLEEKPKHPKSNLAVTGLYFYPSDVFNKVKALRPSSRNELEITDLNRMYLVNEKLNVTKLLRGMVWFDTGTAESLMEASQFIQSLQKHQGFIVGSPHEIAYNSGWISKDELKETALLCEKSNYGQYLMELI